MLYILIEPKELYDNDNNEFIKIERTELHLEHSLDAISKWEAYFEKPFFSSENKTEDEIRYYIQCMSIEPHDPKIYKAFTSADYSTIQAYITKKNTATWVSDNRSKKPRNKEIITAEVIYYWMVSYNIPFECDKWNINKLLTLIRVCDAKNSNQKMSKKDIYNQNKALNAARKAKMNTRG